MPEFRPNRGFRLFATVTDVEQPPDRGGGDDRGLSAQPEAVHDFYNNLKTDLQKAEPNPAHLAITRLQNEYKNGTVSVVTQNVDLLHEKAGNRNVYHIHGRSTRRCA